MKKIIGILGVSVLALTLFMNAAVLTLDSNNEELKVTSFTTTAFANVKACTKPSGLPVIDGSFKPTFKKFCMNALGYICGWEETCEPEMDGVPDCQKIICN